MHEHTENETWLIETGGDVIEKKAASGPTSLTPRERLILCLWATDYGMRNAADLETAADLDPSFHEDGRRLAADLSLPVTLAAFSLARSVLQERYFELFPEICAELRGAS
jgi:hypothetical protein